MVSECSELRIIRINSDLLFGVRIIWIIICRLGLYIFMNKINRKIHKIDANGEAVGRVASNISILLMGKNKASYAPNIDDGDFVEVANICKLKFTGKKLEQKKYYHFSGYPGGLKDKKIKEVFANNPQEVLYKAVYNMLPKNKLRKEFIKRLKFV